MEMSKEQLAEQILSKVNEIPPLSYSAAKLLELMQDEDHSVKEVLKIVENDSVLTANILKVVNSAAFGLLSEISSVSRAIAYLGDRMVAGLAIGTCARDLYNKDLEGYEAQHGDLWKHSLKTAIATRELSSYAKKDIHRDVAYTAGILHDIGKSVLSQFLIGKAPDLIHKLEELEIVNYIEAERGILGTDHTEVGYEVAVHWKLPEAHKQIIRWHHNPVMADDEYRPLVYLVHVADIVAMMSGTGTGMDTLQYPLDTNFDEFIEIEAEQLEALMIEVEEQFTRTAESLFE